MTDEEKAALELQKKVDQEKAGQSELNTRMTGIEKMLKSVLVTDEPQTEIDYSEIDAVEMAKSMAGDPDGQMEFLQNFINNSVVDAVDLVDEDGVELLTEDMRKSIDEGESQGAQVLNLILQTMETNNARSAKRDEVLIAGMAQMAKSFTETSSELIEMKKSLLGTTKSMPDLDGAIQNPGSDDLGGLPQFNDKEDSGDVMVALQKSFRDGKSQPNQTRYYELLEKLNVGYTVEQIKNEMSTAESDIFDSNYS